MPLREPPRWETGHNTHPPECILVEKSDYDGGDPDLTIVKRPDGLYDLVIYKATNDLTVHALSAAQVRRAAERIIALLDHDGPTASD